MQKLIFAIIIIFSLSFTPTLAQEDKPVDEESKVESSKNFFERLSFGPDTFLGKLDGKILKFTDGIESWRSAKETKFGDSIDKVSQKREADKKDAKPATKVMSFLHLILLTVLLFVFSLNTIFYLALIFITFGVLRRLFGFLFGLARNRA